MIDGASIADNKFNRFDDDLIDRYFNDEGKKAIQEYLAKHSEQVEREARINEVKKTYGKLEDLLGEDDSADIMSHYLDSRLKTLKANLQQSNKEK